jgi:hypothetical protein
MVFDHLSVPSLLLLGSSSRDHYIIVRDHLYRRSRDIVRPFVDIPDNMFYVLHWTKSVISGSSALRFMMPVSNTPWRPQDLDIYTPHRQSSSVVNFLRFEGYTETFRLRNGSSTNNNNYNISGGLFDVITMTKGTVSIDIMESATANIIPCITRFHITAVMNFISANGFFSAYPTLTASHYALAGPLGYSPAAEPSPRTVDCYSKYERRGFDINGISNNGQCDIAHTCRRSVRCPHTVRTTFDRDCLFVSFSKDNNTIAYPTPTSARVYNCRDGVIWNIGGRSCNGHYETFHPFMCLQSEFVLPVNIVLINLCFKAVCLPTELYRIVKTYRVRAYALTNIK